MFSAGQKQLLCIARALLSKNKVLLLDEPTANVDMETDKLVQEVVRSYFKECTVLTIAHRMETIIDSDLVVVISGGEAVEVGHPFKLLAEDESDTRIRAKTEFARIVSKTELRWRGQELRHRKCSSKEPARTSISRISKSNDEFIISFKLRN